MSKKNRRLQLIIIVGAVLVALSTAFLIYTRHWEAQSAQTVPGPELPLWVLNGDDGAPEDLPEDMPEDEESDQDPFPVERD